MPRKTVAFEIRKVESWIVTVDLPQEAEYEHAEEIALCRIEGMGVVVPDDILVNTSVRVYQEPVKGNPIIQNIYRGGGWE